jgi:hypothetical protein
MSPQDALDAKDSRLDVAPAPAWPLRRRSDRGDRPLLWHLAIAAALAVVALAAAGSLLA